MRWGVFITLAILLAVVIEWFKLTTGFVVGYIGVMFLLVCLERREVKHLQIMDTIDGRLRLLQAKNK